MHVVATAGHVDHGKSALVQALTGRNPDRYAEEQRRGLTLDLGFAWTTLPGGDVLAFVDVPGHERFVATMLAGVGPVPAVMFVVAADEGWRRQSEEHLVAIDALGARHGVLVVTRPTSPTPNRWCGRSGSGSSGTTLQRHPGRRGEHRHRGRARRAAGLSRAAAGPPRGTGRGRTGQAVGRPVVHDSRRGDRRDRDTGGRPAGDRRRAVVIPAGVRATVRGLQSRERAETRLLPVCRAAVNLRGIDREAVGRGSALVTPGGWTVTSEVDVLVGVDAPLPAEPVVHVGSAAVSARVRPLGPGAARLRLGSALPLHVGDRLLVRDPGSRAVAAVDVVDVAPLPLTRRGDARRLASSLRGDTSASGAVRRRGALRAEELDAAGYAATPTPGERIGSWWVDPTRLAIWRDAVSETLSRLDSESALNGLPSEVLRRRTGIPDLAILDQLLTTDPRWEAAGGRVRPAPTSPPELPGLAALLARLAANPFDAPSAEELDVAPAELAHGVRTGALLALGRGVYVSGRAPELALARLAGLPQPFTMSQARQALGVSRRVGVPLLEHLDRLRRTRRVDGTHRQLVDRG